MGLKVIGLISGGKDSFFTMLHCLSRDHEIVALANLHPAGDEDDIDSFMYQTVGHNVMPLYAEALQLPLYRAPILGRNSVKARDYALQVLGDDQDVDETESLIPLLREAMARHPEANAVSSGPILSSYQRTRVESVASRLGLTPLAYLWQYSYLPPYRQSSLLKDMAAAGQDSRIIKVSTGGLDERHLWLDVCDDRVARAMARYGDANQVGAVLGEGGEFETLAIDGPGPLWKASIQVDDQDRISEAGVGGSSVLVIRKAKTLTKETPTCQEHFRLRTPELLDTEFSSLRQELSQRKGAFTPQGQMLSGQPTFASKAQQPSSSEAYRPSTTLSGGTPTGHLFNVSWTSYSTFNQRSSPRTITEETEIVIDTVRMFNTQTEDIHETEARSPHNASYCRPSAIAFTIILLRSMSDFAAVNAIYSTLFSTPNPPARVTVACGGCMPQDVNVMMSFFIHDVPSQQRDGLHVQSRSYWAPANIGPYSQAISVPVVDLATEKAAQEEELNAEERRAGRMVYVAGQIPLIPATMEIISSDFIEQTVLSLQHLWRIGRAMGVHLWANVVVYITASSHEEARERAVIAGEAWSMMHRRTEAEMDDEDDDEQVDLGDKHLYRTMGRIGVSKQDHDLVHRPPLPDWDRIQVDETGSGNSAENGTCPPCAIVQVSELPRGAAIEWAAIGCIACDEQKIRLAGATVELDRWSTSLDTLMERVDMFEGPTTEYFVKHGHENEDWTGLIVPCRAVFDGCGIEHVAMARQWQQ